jgi:hypothetical protein
VPLPLDAPCKQWRAANDSGARRPSAIGLVVIHSTEGGTAPSVAAYFARATTRASTQLVVDDLACYRCVPDLVIPWGAPGVNRRGLHIEHCGYARWTREQWLAHDRTLERSAAKAARWCWLYRIPRRWLSLAELKAGRKGFCTHAQASKAFPPNAGHHDPGSGFPRDVYMQLVRKHYKALADERAAGAQT